MELYMDPMIWNYIWIHPAPHLIAAPCRRVERLRNRVNCQVAIVLHAVGRAGVYSLAPSSPAADGGWRAAVSFSNLDTHERGFMETTLPFHK